MAEKKYTEREMVLAERLAMENGAIRFSHRGGCCGPGISFEEVRAEIARAIPLPLISRPRVATDPEDGYEQQWRVADGVIEYKAGPDYGRWLPADLAHPSGCTTVTHERIRMWADLLHNPTEYVEDEGGNTPAGRRDGEQP